jgi:hypothetical protein
MEECLYVLETTKSYPTDSLLVYLVRLQLICNKASAINWNLGEAEYKAPNDFYMKAFRSQLKQFKQSIPPELESNCKLISLL